MEFILAMEREIFDLVNAYRNSNDLEALMWHDTLHRSARHKSNSMIQFDYFSHDNPHLNKSTLEYLMWDLYGVDFDVIGENIAVENGYGKSSANAIFELWKDSPEHNKAMLDSEFTHMAVGIAYSPEAGEEHLNTETLSGTQHFGGN